MAVLQEGIVSARVAQLRERHATLSQSEQDFSTGLIGPLALDIGFVAACGVGIVYDAAKSLVRRD